MLGVVKGVAWGDYDNDGWLDLYVSRFGKPNLLFRNDGKRFSMSPAEAGVAEPVNSFPTWFFDYDNDGWLDLFVGGFDEASVRRRCCTLSRHADGPRARRACTATTGTARSRT